VNDSRLGAPVEVPWWVIPLALPPAVATVLAVVLTAALWARALAAITSLVTLVALAVIGGRVSSRNMQSVWISALYAIWVFVIVIWAVSVATPACNCT
jgi:uncharacterized membrane protein YadS